MWAGCTGSNHISTLGTRDELVGAEKQEQFLVTVSQKFENHGVI